MDSVLRTNDIYGDRTVSDADFSGKREWSVRKNPTFCQCTLVLFLWRARLRGMFSVMEFSKAYSFT
jgi:hypothetical protein